MRRHRWFPAVAGLALLLAGCVYYNGMYNARRLAHEAEKAEREGRTFDATSLWGQVGVKADTVLARHPTSSWADDAEYLRGKAYERLGDCTSALPYLEAVLAQSPDSTLIEKSALVLGDCYQKLDRPIDAGRVFARLLASPDSVRRSEALYRHGRSLRLSGQYDQAVTELSRSAVPAARDELVAALAGVGRIRQAQVLGDSLRLAGDTAVPWGAVLALLARHDARAAGRMLDSLLVTPGIMPDSLAAWLTQDGQRLAERDPEAATRRLDQAAQAAAGTPAAREAGLARLQVQLRLADSLGELRRLVPALERQVQLGGAQALTTGALLRNAEIVLAAVDSSLAGHGPADLQFFLAAEVVRDTLGSLPLASRLFQQVADDSLSPFAPKAILALGALQPNRLDSLGAVLRDRYPDSPYLAVVQGDSAPGYAALEDSMRVFGLVFRSAFRPTRQQRRPDDDAVSGGRRPIQ